MPECPTKNQLAGLFNERLSPAEQERLEDHVGECEGCRRRLERLAVDDTEWESLENRLRGDQVSWPDMTAHISMDDDPENWPTVPGYEILDVVGRGGMGIVYESKHTALGRLVALKTLRPAGSGHHELRRRLEREAETLAHLHHPNVVQIYEVLEHDGCVFLALEFIRGGNLSRRLREATLPPTDAAKLVETLARTVQVAHDAGILHRDLKPSNVLMAPDGTPKITDFGLSRRLETRSETRPGAVMGTPSYMAPEQAQGLEGWSTAAVDAYALGAILYECLTGRPPFRADSSYETLRQVVQDEPVPPSRLQPSVPQDLVTICLKCLRKESAKRYPSCAALADDLARFLAGRPVLARRVPATTRVAKWAFRHPLVAALTTGMCVTLGVLLVMWIKHTRDLKVLSNEARQAQREAMESERDAKQQLYQHLRTQIELVPYARRPGERSRTMGAIRQAVALLPNLELSSEELDRDYLSLRNDAIAVLSLFDVETVRRRRVESPWTTSVTFNSTCDQYAQSDPHGNIAVRRFTDDEQIAYFPGEGARAWRLQFSPDDRYLSATYYGGQPAVSVWDIGKQRAVLQTTERTTYGRTRFTHDSSRIAIGFPNGKEPEIRLYRLSDGQLEQKLSVDDEPTALCFSTSSDALAFAGWNKPGVTIWRLADETTSQIASELLVKDVSWNSEGLMALSCNDGRIVLAESNENTGKQTILKAHNSQVFSARLSPRDNMLISDAGDGTVRFWNLGNQQEELRIDSARLLDSAISRNGREVAFGTEDKCFGIWRLPENVPWRVLRNNKDPAVRMGVHYMPGDGRLLASATASGIEIWDTATLQLAASLPNGRTDSAIFAPDGSSLITTGSNGVQRWPIEVSTANHDRRTIRSPVVIRKGDLRRATLNAEGTLLAVVRGYNTANVVKLDLPSASTWIRGHPKLTYSVISPDGRWVATTAWQGTGVRIWNADSGELAADLDPSFGSAAAAFSPDGKLFVACSGEEIGAWTVGSWRSRYRIQKAVVDLSPEPIAFSPDGRMLAVPYSRRLVQLLDPNTGATLAVLRSPHPRALNMSCCFSPDARHIAYTASEEIHIWDLALLRQQLAELELDWDLPPYPSVRAEAPPAPLVVDVALQEKPSRKSDGQ